MITRSSLGEAYQLNSLKVSIILWEGHRKAVAQAGNMTKET